MRQTPATAVLLSLAATLALCAAAHGKKTADTRLDRPPLETARQILTALDDAETDGKIAALGGHLATSPQECEQVLAALAEDESIEAATLRAELLVWAARGEPAVQKYRPRGAPKPKTMSTERIGALAGPLLEHGDPFIRGLAEWAIAIRLGMECEGRRSEPWPDPEDCAWYARWLAVDEESQLQCDYVCQAVVQGHHRATRGLLQSSQDTTTRVEGLTAWMHPKADPARRDAIAKSLRALSEARARLEQCAKDHPGDLTGQRRLWLAMRRAARQVVMRNPDLDFGRILFATRTGPDSGNITNGGVRDVYGAGGDLYVKTGLSPSDPARPLIQGRLGPGHFRGLDLWWDADRLVFAYVKQPGYDRTKDAVHENTEMGRSHAAHLYEMDIDGSALRQLTDAPYNSDLEPCYLPGGDLVFVSDRSNYGSQCAGSFHQDKMILNLYRCSPDGTGIRALSNNKDFDRYPHMMENGQVLFLHWEYQERHLWQTHTLWTCRPDGSMTDAIYKQHIEGGPMSLREARQIPGRSQLVAVACGHHNGEIGAVFTVDYTRGINDPEGMRNVTPGVSKTEGGYGRTKTVEEGGVEDAGGHYQFPYPLSDKSFLAAYSYKKPESAAGRNYALYYIDVWGNKELIHRERHLSVAYLMPLAPRARPRTFPERPGAPYAVPNSGIRYATVYVANVDNDMPGVEPGTIKYLRIAQKTPWPCVRQEDKQCGYNDLHASPTGAWTPMLGVWDWSPTRSIGIVPVEEDGSAWFKVPVDQTLYFQALDKDFVEVRRMRSNVTFQNGEYRGCIGCHESRCLAPTPGKDALPLALKREPSMPEPPAWGAADVPGFERHIQPILQRHCVRCHGEKEPDGGIELTSRKIGDYQQSYRTLFGLKASEPTPVASEDGWRWLHPNDPMPPADKAFFKRLMRNEQPDQLIALADRFGGAEVTPPLAFGSARSKLILTLLDDKLHRDEVKMSREDWVALVTWVDLNAPYFDTYANKETTRGGKPAQWVRVKFPDPWTTPPAGEWIWKDEKTVVLNP